MDQETIIVQLQQQLQQMQQQMAQFMAAQATNPPAPEIVEAPVTSGASKKIKIPAPEPFDSKREKLKTFLRQCNLVFSGDRKNYEEDQDKIMYALSLMRGGIAEEWAGTMMDNEKEHERGKPLTPLKIGQIIVWKWKPLSEIQIQKIQLR